MWIKFLQADLAGKVLFQGVFFSGDLKFFAW